MTGVVLAAVALGVPALAFALWPLFRRESGTTFLSVPPDARQELTEQKRRLLRSLRELDFEHDAGHVSDADYADLRSRYEAETAAVLAQLDRLGGPEPVPAAAAPVARGPALGWRHPAAVAVAAVALIAFGIALGAGVVRYTTPDSTAGVPALAGRSPGDVTVPPPGTAPQPSGGRLSPEMLQGMLQAARASLAAGRYGEAAAAYQAVLKRDPDNVDAMTHLALMVAISGHDPGAVDAALETFDRALTLEPNYPPALLYRGQVLWETKRDAKGAIASWEKFLAVTPPGEDHARVRELIARAKAGAPPAR